MNLGKQYSKHVMKDVAARSPLFVRLDMDEIDFLRKSNVTVLMLNNMLIGSEQALDKSKAETGREIQLPLPRCPQRYSRKAREGHVYIISNDFIENTAKQK